MISYDISEVSKPVTRVAGVDGAPGGWAALIIQDGRWKVRMVTTLSEIALENSEFDVIAVDMPIGLPDTYEVGGRACDRSARKMLGKRHSTVFPAPVRATLEANNWEEACKLSRGSGLEGRAISKQAFGILPKIREIDELLQSNSRLRLIIKEVHPEICFTALNNGVPMRYTKKTKIGGAERRDALKTAFPEIDAILASGRKQGLARVDMLDAAVAAWSALRLASGMGSNLPENLPTDRTGLPMAIWY